jgi:hypothetical protein
MTDTHPQNRRIGYARVSTCGQTLDAQLEQLRGAGCEKIFSIRSGDALIVRKHHRLARSMKQLIENYRNSSGEGNWVSQLDRTSRYDDRAGKACSHMVGCVSRIRAQLDSRAHPSGPRRGALATREVVRRDLRDDDIEAAKAMLANPGIGVVQISVLPRVSTATFCRYIPVAPLQIPQALE